MLRKISAIFYSVRFRLSLWYLGILTLMLVIFGGIVYYIEYTALSSQIDSVLKLGSQQFPALINTQQNPPQFNEGFTSAVRTLESNVIPSSVLDQLPDIPGVKPLLEGKFIILLTDAQNKPVQKFGAVSDRDARELATMAASNSKTEAVFTEYKLAAPPPATPSRTGQIVNTPSDYRVSFYPLQNSNKEIIGHLIVGLPWDGAATLQSLAVVLLLAGLVALLLAAGGGYWLASKAMRPVRDITRTAYEIGETDLSRRLNIKRRDELGELASTFNRMLSRLEAAFNRQRQFTANASHDLRTPLTVVNLEVNRALNRRRTPEEYEQALSVIQGETEYMTQLVNDLLMLTRADTGQISFETEKIDVSELALEVVERLTPLARQKGLQLNVGELPELEITGNRLYLTRMISNLVDNAIKYTSGAGSRVQIETGNVIGPAQYEVKAGVKWMWLQVSDDGPGIAAEHLPYLFDRFYKVDKARTAGETLDPEVQSETRGSGLGLAIVQLVAQTHGGHVKIESQVGKGTSFIVWLPLSS